MTTEYTRRSCPQRRKINVLHAAYLPEINNWSKFFYISDPLTSIYIYKCIYCLGFNINKRYSGRARGTIKVSINCANHTHTQRFVVAVCRVLEIIAAVRNTCVCIILTFMIFYEQIHGENFEKKNYYFRGLG